MAKSVVRAHYRKLGTRRVKVKKHLRIPKSAKRKAKSALEKRKNLPKSRKFGLSASEARKQGVDSGVTRARRIIKNDTMPLWEAKKVCRFKRFTKRKRTPKIQGAIDLWGGDQFIKKACKYVKR